MTPTQRSLAMLRAEGWLVAVVEKWNVHAKVRQDLFGFADLLAIKDNATLAVQTTSGCNVSQRLHKITANAAATLWLRSPHREIVVHGWRKRGPRGRRKVWHCRVVRVSDDSLPPSLGSEIETATPQRAECRPEPADQQANPEVGFVKCS
jgi:hypothetical protein